VPNQYLRTFPLHLGNGLGDSFCFFQIFIFYFCSGAFWGTEIPSLALVLFFWCCVVGGNPPALGLHVPLRPYLPSFFFICYFLCIFFDVSLTFFHLVCGFFPIALSLWFLPCFHIETFLSHNCVILYHRISVFFLKFLWSFIYFISSGSLHSPFPIWKLLCHYLTNTGSWLLNSCPMPTSLS